MRQIRHATEDQVQWAVRRFGPIHAGSELRKRGILPPIAGGSGVTIVGALAGQIITSGGLNTFTNTGLAINQHDTLVLWCSDVESAATTTATGVADNKTNTWPGSPTASQADVVIDGTHHGSGSLWVCQDAIAAVSAALTVTVTLSGATHNAYAFIVLRGADNVNTVANSGAAVAMSTSHPGSSPNPTTFTSTSVTDNSTLDQAIGIAACWPNSGTDSSVAGSGATKVISIAQNGGSNLCCVSLNAGSINGTNNVLGSVCNIAGVASLVLGTIVITAAGGGGGASPSPYVPLSRMPLGC